MEITDKGDAAELIVGFEYRPLRSSLEKEVDSRWTSTNLMTINTSGSYDLMVTDELFKGLQNPDDKDNAGITNASLSVPGVEYRAIVYQNNLKMEGNPLAIKND